MILDNLNFLILAILAPLLVFVGILGFIIPANKCPTSRASPYNYFHIVLGLIGAGIVLSNHETAVRSFNICFGLIGLYQALASFANLFPKQYFKWTRTDDVLHIVIGAALALIGIFGK
jgi:hypothetical protein